SAHAVHITAAESSIAVPPMTAQPSDVAANVKIDNTASPPTSESKKHHYSSSRKTVIAKNSNAQKFFEAFIERLTSDRSQPRTKETASTESKPSYATIADVKSNPPKLVNTSWKILHK